MPEYIGSLSLDSSKEPFALLHIVSIGFKSGLYAEKETTLLPSLPRTASSATCDVCEERLSMMTISPSAGMARGFFEHALQELLRYAILQKKLCCPVMTTGRYDRQ